MEARHNNFDISLTTLCHISLLNAKNTLVQSAVFRSTCLHVSEFVLPLNGSLFFFAIPLDDSVCR